MSTTPNNLPKRTRTLVKDLLFQEKYHLTDTQVDIVSYIFNAFTWTMKVDGFMVLTSKKILSDLPRIGSKTLDATLRELEKKGLIKRSLVTVENWNNARVRGIKMTPNGREYNSSLYTPTQQEIEKVYQERIDELEKENRALKAEKESKSEKVEKISETEASAPKNEPLKEKSEAKSVDSVSVEASQSETLDDFVRRVRNRFLLTSEPLCNDVKGWQRETTFYINSYGKLSLTTPDMDFSQLSNPIEIHRFWQWLFEHQERIGDIVQIEPKDIEWLNSKYKNQTIQLNNQTVTIEEIVQVGDKFSLKIRGKNGKMGTLYDASKRPKLFDFEALEKRILKVETPPEKDKRYP